MTWLIFNRHQLVFKWNGQSLMIQELILKPDHGFGLRDPYVEGGIVGYT